MGKCKSTCLAVLFFLGSGIPGADPGFLQGGGGLLHPYSTSFLMGYREKLAIAIGESGRHAPPESFFFHFDVLWLLLGTIWDNNRMEAAPEVQMPPPTILYNCYCRHPLQSTMKHIFVFSSNTVVRAYFPENI